MRNLLLLFSLVLSSATFAQVTYLTDDFNIPAGNLLINNGWYAHSGSGTNSVQAVSPALSWGSYVLSNQGNAAGVTNTGEDVNKPFPSYPNTGVVYASFMVRLNNPTSSTAGYFFHMGYYDSQTPNAGFTNLNTAHRARTYVQPGTNPSTQFQLGLAFNATTAQGYTADLNIGQTYLVVVKYEFVAGALNDIVSLFVFAEGDNAFAEPATPTLGPFTSTGSAADAPSIQAVALRQYNATQNVIVDGIVVRDFWQLVPDCNGDIGGTAYLDGCDVCVEGNTGLEPCAVDCNGDLNGTAFLDNCNTCVGGNTGLSACVADCNGDFGGTAFLDNCSVCVGGNTGVTACLPDCNGNFGGTAYLDACNNCVAGNTGETPCLVTFLEDQFDYPAADPLTNHGWFAHSAAATNPILVHSAGLVFTDYLGSDIGNAGAVTNTGQDANKPFSTNANVGDVYASYLIRVDDPVVAASEGFFMHFGTYNNTENPTFTSLSTAFRGRVHIALGDEANKFKLGLSFNAAAASSTSADLNVGQTYLVVVKYQFIPGATNDNVSLYVFAQGDDFSMEPTGPTLGPLTATPTDPLDPLSPLAADAPVIQAIALRQYNAAQEVIVDGIIVRNVWDLFGACIPPAEPTNLACWETATLNEQTCEWEISGTQPAEPTNLACWETTSFNNMTCEWEVSGTQPAEPTNLACWETTSFNNMTCEWEISGTQPIPAFAAVGPYCSGDIIPDLLTTSFNNFEGAWSPAINNTETTVYTFTPTEGQCAGTVTLTITIQNCGGNGPINDEPCGALEITSSGQTELNTYSFLSTMACNNQTGNNTNATPSVVGASCGGTSGRSMWYTFTTPSCDVNGMVPFEIEFSTNNAGTNFNTKLAIFESNDNDCDGIFTELACNDDHNGAGNPALCDAAGATTSTIVTNLQPNKQYWVYVDGFNAEFGDFVLSGRALTPAHGAIATGGGTQIQLSTANMGAGLYTYYYKQVGSTGHSTSNSASALTNVRTLAPGNDYITQIMYRCGANAQASQFYRTAPQTIALASTCAVVNDMTCAFNGENSYMLSWTQPMGDLYTDGGLSGYRIKRSPVGSTGVYTFSNPAVVCENGTCSVTLPGNSPTGFNWTIETRCSANTIQVGNTTACAPDPGMTLGNDNSNDVNRTMQHTFSFVNAEAGIEFVDVQMHDAYADFGLNTPMIGDYEMYVNSKNEITWRRVETTVNTNFDFVIVPNPSNAMTTVHLNTVVEAGSFTIVDAMGRTIQTGSINNEDKVNIDADQLQSGVYLVVVTVEGVQMTKRLVVAE